MKKITTLAFIISLTTSAHAQGITLFTLNKNPQNNLIGEIHPTKMQEECLMTISEIANLPRGKDIVMGAICDTQKTPTIGLIWPETKTATGTGILKDMKPHNNFTGTLIVDQRAQTQDAVRLRPFGECKDNKEVITICIKNGKIEAFGNKSPLKGF